MLVSGEDAKRFNAVRLDSYANVNTGELVEADDATGVVKWHDTPDTVKTVSLGERQIRLVPRTR